MSQQINLLNPALIKKKNVLDTTNIVAIFSVLVVGLVTLTLLEFDQLRSTNAKLEKTSTELAEVETLLTQLRADTTNITEKKRLRREIESLERKEAMQEAILEAAQHDQAHRSESYAALLKAFARQSMDGLWITALSIDQDAKHLSISGRTTNPDLVPEYLSRLRNEPVLHGKTFTDLNMQYHVEKMQHNNQTAVENQLAQKASSKTQSTKATVEPQFDQPVEYISFTLRSVPDETTNGTNVNTAQKVVGVN